MNGVYWSGKNKNNGSKRTMAAMNALSSASLHLDGQSNQAIICVHSSARLESKSLWSVPVIPSSLLRQSMMAARDTLENTSLDYFFIEATAATADCTTTPYYLIIHCRKLRLLSLVKNDHGACGTTR
jgi:hypothetical protein